eukprot:TRINITY_DN70452_c0_g1_i1.p1 TRINITY_DN70452_c0_g1~~TRINITY_DN70452_c0_g1_i1.p1  ORF type:complete len:1359 (+),score=246.84 TRINITY_DN70452_c0_g1_i1:139-4215(+)
MEASRTTTCRRASWLGMSGPRGLSLALVVMELAGSSVHPLTAAAADSPAMQAGQWPVGGGGLELGTDGFGEAEGAAGGAETLQPATAWSAAAAEHRKKAPAEDKASPAPARRPPPPPPQELASKDSKASNSSEKTGKHAKEDEDLKDKDASCLHGHYHNKTKRCICDAGWRESGITDPTNFLTGACDQYRCSSDEKCVDHLGIEGATCPMPTWNCYCGWSYAWDNLLGGYETPVHRSKGGKCMGVMYTFAFWATYTLRGFLYHSWRVFFWMSLALLPFGRKRANCDHHRPSLWRWLRWLANYQSSCRGECVMESTYTLTTFKDDMAWTLYILDLGVWAYAFAVAFWIVLEFLWMFALVTLVVLVTIVVIIGSIIAMLGDCASCECGCPACDAGGCPGLGGFCDGCCQAHLLGCDACMGPTTIHSPAEFMYLSGPFPYDPFWGYGGYGYSEPPDSDQRSCCLKLMQNLCKPIAGLVYVFPVMPENAWGGVFGYFVAGTHHLTPANRVYGGGNRAIEFLRMGWRRNVDLHDNQGWRLQVSNFLTGDGNEVGFGVLDDDREDRPAFPELEPFLMPDGQRRACIPVGRAKALPVDRPFDITSDQCVSSSFDDYKANQCWICRESNPSWDLWLSCRHLFCSDCSTQMLRRRMPCPLCRVSSSVVIRGRAMDGESSQEALPRLQSVPGQQAAQNTPLSPTGTPSSVDSGRRPTPQPAPQFIRTPVSPQPQSTRPPQQQQMPYASNRLPVRPAQAGIELPQRDRPDQVARSPADAAGGRGLAEARELQSGHAPPSRPDPASPALRAPSGEEQEVLDRARANVASANLVESRTAEYKAESRQLLGNLLDSPRAGERSQPSRVMSGEGRLRVKVLQLGDLSAGHAAARGGAQEHLYDVHVGLRSQNRSEWAQLASATASRPGKPAEFNADAVEILVRDGADHLILEVFPHGSPPQADKRPIGNMVIPLQPYVGTNTGAMLITDALRSPVEEYTVDLYKGANQQLGLQLCGRHRGSLLKVQDITSGLITKWNEEHPEAVVKTGDDIVGVNGLAGERNLLRECAKEDIQLNIKLQRVVDKSASHYQLQFELSYTHMTASPSSPQQQGTPKDGGATSTAADADARSGTEFTEEDLLVPPEAAASRFSPRGGSSSMALVDRDRAGTGRSRRPTWEESPVQPPSNAEAEDSQPQPESQTEVFEATSSVAAAAHPKSAELHEAALAEQAVDAWAAELAAEAATNADSTATCNAVAAADPAPRGDGEVAPAASSESDTLAAAASERAVEAAIADMVAEASLLPAAALASSAREQPANVTAMAVLEAEPAAEDTGVRETPAADLETLSVMTPDERAIDAMWSEVALADSLSERGS